MLLNKLMFCMVLYCSGMAQQASISNNPTLVQTEWTSDWGHKIFIFPPNYWDSKEDEVVKQIGRHEFEKVKQMSDRFNMPCAMQVFCEDIDRKPKKNSDTLNMKYGKLNVYKIATFYHTSSHGVTSGPYAILRVPYPENKGWDKAAVWDTVYFVISDKYIRPLTPGFVQKSAPAVNRFPLIKINKWENAVFNLYDKYWSENEMEDTVSRQIGSVNSSTINVYFRRNEVPKQMLRESYAGAREYSAAMNKLKVYRVASYEKINENGTREKYCIVRIPYDPNWNPSVKWDTMKYNKIFIVVPEKDVQTADGESLKSL